MLYAKVVLGLAVEGPFDYFVPQDLHKKIKPGVRVEVGLRNKKMVGYVVGLSKKTDIKNTKPILKVLDASAALDKNMLSLTRELSAYYCCFLGEAIETALPGALRKGKVISVVQSAQRSVERGKQEAILIHDLDGVARWERYVEAIKETLAKSRSVIILLPDIQSVKRAQALINERLKVSLALLYRKERGELGEWLKIKEGKAEVVLSTRSGIFAPLNNLGLVILDEEQDPVYKQDQVPHYHAREVALMRIKIDKAGLILGSGSPSLESIYLARKNKIKQALIPRKRDFPEIKIIDTKFQRRGFKQGSIVLSKYLQDAIASSLNSKEKVLLFLNRRGFATSAYCHTCGASLKCPRCNINLVYHFNKNILNCHYCNFKMQVPLICPTCNSGYIKYSGEGTEKIESELSRIFVQARIKRPENYERLELEGADIVVATSSVIKQTGYRFDLTGVLSIDNALNRIDLRAAEKTFALLSGLLRLTEKKLVIQTGLSHHHCFQALLKKDPDIFYDEELKQRKQLHFPPYRHMVLVKLRGKKEERVKEASLALFERLNKINKNKGIKIVSLNPGQPPKLRGNFYWQILITSDNAKKASAFLKINLKTFPSSGIIVTVDVDPI
jgi:primosomal protein N' (replication factor Y)